MWSREGRSTVVVLYLGFWKTRLRAHTVRFKPGAERQVGLRPRRAPRVRPQLRTVLRWPLHVRYDLTASSFFDPRTLCAQNSSCRPTAVVFIERVTILDSSTVGPVSVDTMPGANVSIEYTVSNGGNDIDVLVTPQHAEVLSAGARLIIISAIFNRNKCRICPLCLQFHRKLREEQRYK
jgi:hypothetical protein